MLLARIGPLWVQRLSMSRIYTSKYSPGRARWELVVSPEGDVYAFPLTLAIAQRHVLDGHRRYLVGRVTKGDGVWTATSPSGLVFGSRFPSLAAAVEIVADEVDLAPVA
jgi:hypothetical protein